MKHTITLISLLLIMFFSNCSSTFDLKTEQANLLQADREWSEAARTNDMERLWSFWTDDAKILLSADKTLSGLEEIKQFTTNVRTDPNFELKWEAKGADISESGKMGYTYGIGKVTRTGEDGKSISIESPYLIVWEKQPNGSWKCVIEN